MTRLRILLLVGLATIGLVFAFLGLGQRRGPDPGGLPPYVPAANVSGNLQSSGADNMDTLMRLWTDEFTRHHPDVTVRIKSLGSTTGPPSLIDGTATLAPMSRELRREERQEIESRFGHPATQLRTCIDTLAIFVHERNPIAGLSLEQLDAIFSSSRSRGHATEIRTWGDLGLRGEWRDRPIAAYGHRSDSSSYGFFKAVALSGGDFADRVDSLAEPSAIVSHVESDISGIGYTGIAYGGRGVRAVPVGREGDSFAAPTPPGTYSGEYPLSRFLYLTINLEPGRRLEPLRLEFLKLVFSREGQALVERARYLPLPPTLAAEEMRKVTATESRP